MTSPGETAEATAAGLVPRQRELVNHLRVQGATDVTVLSRLLGVSVFTVRRDLDELHARGLVDRHHGGASAVGSDMLLSWPSRSASCRDEKERIAGAAAELVEEGSTVLITGGTTTEALLPHLARRRALTVVTNSFVVATRLAAAEHLELVLLGGVLRRREMTTLGHLTVGALAELCVEQVITGAYALDAGAGITRTNLAELQTDQVLLAAGHGLVVLADGTKFGRPAPARLAPAERISTVVTDTTAPAEQLERFREAGTEVVVA
jgi:DeoR/GlpR family transcriptional regulator of sugar metabolism